MINIHFCACGGGDIYKEYGSSGEVIVDRSENPSSATAFLSSSLLFAILAGPGRYIFYRFLVLPSISHFNILSSFLRQAL